MGQARLSPMSVCRRCAGPRWNGIGRPQGVEHLASSHRATPFRLWTTGAGTYAVTKYRLGVQLRSIFCGQYPMKYSRLLCRNKQL